MDMVHKFQSKRQKVQNCGLGFDLHTHMVIVRVPNSWILKLIARAFLLALVIASTPRLGTIVREFASKFRGGAANGRLEFAVDPINVEILPQLVRDLKHEGLIRMGDRSLLFTNSDEETIYDSPLLSDNGIDVISYSDLQRQKLVPNETYDFVFSPDFLSAAPEFIDRILKLGGIAAVRLSAKPISEFPMPSNYKLVYLRRFTPTIIALRKTSYSGKNKNSPSKRRLFALPSEAKKAALKKLEDVLLEPPRAASGKSKTYLKRTRYLPDLMGDSLESYPRRVFIEVGPPEKTDVAGDSGWFRRHYPTRNKDFEIYKIETVAEEFSGREVAQIGMSDWLRKNVKENEYVVMKAEAEVVEEMMKDKAVRLVDELFLECKHQGIKKGHGRRSRRAYWECLALYGRLRDEGVAVHQWWG